MGDMSNHPSDKYRMFRNYMTNELGITRGDIEQWTRDAVQLEVEKYLKSDHNLLGNTTKRVLRMVFDYRVMNEIKDRVVRAITKAMFTHMRLDFQRVNEIVRAQEEEDEFGPVKL